MLIYTFNQFYNMMKTVKKSNYCFDINVFIFFNTIWFFKYVISVFISFLWVFTYEKQLKCVDFLTASSVSHKKVNYDDVYTFTLNIFETYDIIMCIIIFCQLRNKFKLLDITIQHDMIQF